MSRLWARSSRGRVTVIASAVAALAPTPSAPVGVAVDKGAIGRRTRSVPSAKTMKVIVLAHLTAFAALAGWAGWVATGRALRPVATMRSELDDANARDLSRRVTQPPGDDEVARLARSVNATLARVERAALQQRQFASDASHELRTPVAGLRAQLETAQLYPDDTDLQALVRSALRDTERLEAIIDDLLLLAKIGTRVDVERVELCRAGPPGAGRAYGQAPRPGEAVAGRGRPGGQDAARPGCWRTCWTTPSATGDSEVRVIVTREGDQAVLAVENDGADIPLEDRERIFDRFARLDAARSRDAGGTGLGLAIARDVAIAHRGDIRVEDCPGCARFVLRLPAG